MRGTVIAEFAGTVAEARAYVAENRVNYPQNMGLSVNSLPHLSLPYASHEQLESAVARFAALGWDRGSLTITRIDR